MTDKQKAAFLRSEGWKSGRLAYGGLYWGDPKEAGPWKAAHPLDTAYRIASRRKSARETRRLKAAGFCFVEKDCWVRMPFKVNIGRPVGIPGYTKSEALKLLEAGNG